MNLSRDWDVIVAGIMTVALAFFVGVPIAGDLALGETLMERVYEVEPSIDRNVVVDQITDSLLVSASSRNGAIFIAAVVVFVVVWSRPAVSWLREDFPTEVYRPAREWLTRAGRSEDTVGADASETTGDPQIRLASDAAKSECGVDQSSPQPLVRPPAEAPPRSTRATVLCDVVFALGATATLCFFALVGLPDREGVAAVLAGDIVAEYPTVAQAPLQNGLAERLRDSDAYKERMFAGLLGALCALLWSRPFFMLFRGPASGPSYPTIGRPVECS